MALLFELRQKLSRGFAAGWAPWPRKEKKVDAEKAWNQKVTTPEIEDKVFEAYEWQIPMLLEREPKYRPLLGSWLRGEEWNNEPPTPPTMTRSPAIVKPITTMAEHQLDAQARIRSLIATGMEPEEARRQVYLAMGWVKE